MHVCRRVCNDSRIVSGRGADIAHKTEENLVRAEELSGTNGQGLLPSNCLVPPIQAFAPLPFAPLSGPYRSGREGMNVYS